MSLDPTLRLWSFRVVGAGNGGLLFRCTTHQTLVSKSSKHPLPSEEDTLRELIGNVLLDALSHNPVVNFCNWVISPAFGLFQPSKFGIHKTSSRNKERASPLATVKMYVALTGGMMRALSISDSP